MDTNMQYEALFNTLIKQKVITQEQYTAELNKLKIKEYDKRHENQEYNNKNDFSIIRLSLQK